jgi:hypothetical protein
VQTINVHAFSIDLRRYNITKLLLNGRQIIVPAEVTGKIWHPKLDLTFHQDVSEYQLSGRMQTVLATAGPLLLVVPNVIPLQNLSIALRVAHDLNKFHKLDSEIIRSSEAMRRGEEDRLRAGNIVVIGDPHSTFSHWCFHRQASAFDICVSPPQLNGRPLEGKSQGILDL